MFMFAGPLLATLSRFLIGGLVVGGIQAIVGRILIALGVSFVTYTGVSIAFDSAKSYVYQQLSGLPAEMLALAGLAGLGKAIGIIFAAFAARLALNGVNKAGNLIQARLTKG
ncbi:hypothetical protein GCM10007907_16870 [Chitinimonas prasina]|uniref:DUF2523 domain-containing protein n=1 Tax=Chitinimonas prasina TaxID=1434937 RepID=A0ABQ5YGV8_9NEIS|nr:DUF2523 family protein [Chitinimonas prasina]GLR12897.1 hypothetical protein GCM10007907_16870 [Chitinimonas prasina]